MVQVVSAREAGGPDCTELALKEVRTLASIGGSRLSVCNSSTRRTSSV